MTIVHQKKKLSHLDTTDFQNTTNGDSLNVSSSNIIQNVHSKERWNRTWSSENRDDNNYAVYYEKTNIV